MPLGPAAQAGATRTRTVHRGGNDELGTVRGYSLVCSRGAASRSFLPWLEPACPHCDRGQRVFLGGGHAPRLFTNSNQQALTHMVCLIQIKGMLHKATIKGQQVLAAM